MNQINGWQRAFSAKRNNLLVVAVLIGVGLVVLSGCGQRYIDINFERVVTSEPPVWIGVYYLSNNTILDTIDNDQLTLPGGVPLGGGVLYKEVFSLSSGGDITFPRPSYDQDILFVVVAAKSPLEGSCVRQKIEVKKGSKLTITATLDGGCIDIKLED